MQKGLGLSMYTLTASYQCQNLYGSSAPSSWDGFHVCGFLHHSMCGPMKDNHVTIPQAAPYYRLFACVHTITQLVWWFRYLDTSYPKGALSKSPPPGEKDEPGFIPALQEVHCGSWSNAQHCATSFESRGMRTWPGDLELIPSDILLVARVFIMKTTGVMTLIIIGYHWQQHF